MKNIKDVAEIRNIVIDIIFCGFIGFCVSQTDALHNFADMIDIVWQTESYCADETLCIEETDIKMSEDNKIQTESLNDVNTHINDFFPMKEELIGLSGLLMKTTGVRDYYNDEFGINVTSNGYVIGQYDETSTNYEVMQMIELKKYLDEKGIKLLYVNEPAKYIDDCVYRNEFGAESYLNRNMDLFLKRISEAGIDYLDLRECIRDDNLDCYSLFYRTDHHWTNPAAKWAAGKIAEKLNQHYGYDINLDLYDDNNFNYVEYQNCWLGEQGCKLAESYIGLDNYTVVIPLYNTNFCRWMSDAEAADWTGDTYTEGDFSIFIDYSRYEDKYDEKGEMQPAKLNSWHYSYNGDGNIQNNNVEYGNVLIFGDSYERNMIPFLSLGIRNIHKIEPRYMTSKDILETIDNGEFDTVILTYGQFMVGAHDDINNANYRQFSFFE